MTTTRILGDNVPRKSNFDPDLARKITKYYEEHPEELELPKNEPFVGTAGGLEIIPGNYLTAIQTAIPETIQTSAEIHKSRVESDDASLDKVSLYTANVALYGVENRKTFFLFGEREAFLRLYVPHIEKVFQQIMRKGYYALPSTDKAWALDEGIRSGALHRFDLAELMETKDGSDFSYCAINTQKPGKVTDAKRKLGELIYGRGNDYFKSMQFFADHQTIETKISLLNSKFVRSIAKKNIFGLASWTHNFSKDSSFCCSGRGVEYDNHLRGVRKK